MAHYTVNHTCGCEETVQLFGAEKDRASKIEWMAKKPCAACAAKKDAETAAAKNLPELTGSDKQIAWANDLRNEVLPTLKGEAYETAVKQTSARWWIDNYRW